MPQFDPTPSPDSKPSETDSLVRGQLLNEVLEATLLARRRSLSEEEWSHLRSASLIHSDELLSTVALIEVLLKDRFAGLANKPGVRERMSQQIAATLLADPYARQRLAEFRKFLSESRD